MIVEKTLTQSESTIPANIETLGQNLSIQKAHIDLESQVLVDVIQKMEILDLENINLLMTYLQKDSMFYLKTYQLEKELSYWEIGIAILNPHQL